MAGRLVRSGRLSITWTIHATKGGSMLMSIQGQNRLMVVVVKDYQRKFTEALGLSAYRGGYFQDMGGMVARLVMWERSGDIDFQKWFALTQEAGDMWIEWYDWYTRMDKRLSKSA